MWETVQNYYAKLKFKKVFLDLWAFFLGRQKGVLSLRWTKLAKVGGSPIVKFTIFVPFFGYLVLYNEFAGGLYCDLEVFLGLTTECVPEDSLYRIHVLFLGLLSLSVGSLVFFLACPEQVKEHGNRIDFLVSENRVKDAYTQKKYFDDFADRLGDTFVTSFQRHLEKAGTSGRALSKETIPEILDENWNDFLSLAFDSMDLSRHALRACCTIAFYVGFGLIGYKSVVIAVQALQATVVRGI